MLKHIEFHDYADRIQNAVYNVLKEKKFITKDLGGNATTTEFTNAIIGKLIG